MKTQTMRLIDRYVGIPVCILLSWLAPIFVRRPRSNEANVVVVCKFFGIGSMCLSYPLMYELKKQGYEIVYLTFRSNEPMAKFLGVERCLSINPESLWRFSLDVVRVIWQLRRLRPQAFLNLEFFSQFAAIMSLMSGAPVRSGFHMLHMVVGRLYSHKTNLNVYRPIAENYFNVGARAGLIGLAGEMGNCEMYIEKFDPPVTAKPPADVPDGCIVINIESSDTIRDLKIWPVGNWVELIASLRDKFKDRDIVLIGTRESGDLHDELTKRLPAESPILNYAGRTTFDEFAGLIARAGIVITIDSGPTHLSALLKRPTVALYGPETPVLYGHDLPWVRTIYKGLICSPCLAIYDAKQSVLDCRDNQCMKQITPQEVMNAVEELL